MEHIKDILVRIYEEKLSQQCEKGFSKYGVTLDDVDYSLYDWNVMALEESIDLNQYLLKENKRLRAQLIKQEMEMKGRMTLNDTTKLIKQWAYDRNLVDAEPTKQALKLGEEFGELCQGLAKGNRDLIIDSIGDMYVVMTILSMQLSIDIEDCVKIAYNEIKDRKGKMINGVFVKESDLQKEGE